MVAAAHFGLFWPELAVSACFGGRFVWNQLYRHVSAVSVPVSAGIGLFWPKSAPIWLSRHESKKKKGRVGELDTASDSGTATLEPRRCFLASK